MTMDDCNYSEDDDNDDNTELQKIQTKCDKFALSRFPSAVLGWVPKPRTRPGYPFNSAFGYVSIMWCCPCRKMVIMLQFRRLLATTSPYILPKRYHSMDCKSLIKLSSKGMKNLYLENASQFLVFSQVYGVGYWSHLEALIKKATKMDLSITPLVAKNFFHKRSRQFSTFEDPENDLHQCKDPKEFLTNPWVLVQLPWHPVLFHQWLVAALAEVHKLKKHFMAEFCSWPIPPQCIKRVRLILDRVEHLHFLIFTGFRLLGLQVSQWPDSFDTRVPGHILHTVVLPAMHHLQFFLHPETLPAVDALKQLIWPGKATSEVGAMRLLVARHYCFEMESIYGLRYTCGAKPCGPLFGTPSKFSLDSIIQELHNFSPRIKLVDSNYECAAKFNSWTTAECLQDKSDFTAKKAQKDLKFLVAEIVKKHLVSANGAAIEIPSFGESLDLLAALSLTHNPIFALDQVGVDKTEFSFQLNINHLALAAVLAEYEVYIARFVQRLLQKGGIKTFLRPNVSAKVQPKTWAQVEQTLKNIDASSKPWSLEFLRKQFPAEVKYKFTCVDEPCVRSLTSEVIGTHQLIKKFQLRIKNLVYYMFEECLKAADGAEEESAFLFPEWQFVQYLLPCFVALIDDLVRVKVKQTELTLFVKVVDSLIQSYETHLDRQPLKMQKNLNEPPWLLKNRMAYTHSKFDTILNDLGLLVHGPTVRKDDYLVTNTLTRAFAFFVDIVEAKKPQKIDDEGTKYLLTEHCLQVEKFTCRLNTCIYRVKFDQLCEPAVTNMMQVLKVLHELHKVVTISQELYVIEDAASVLFEYVDCKIKALFYKEQEAPPFQKCNRRKKVLSEARNLQVQEMLGILLHYCVLQLKKCQPQIRNKFLQEDLGANCQLVNKAFVICQKQSWHELKMLLVPLLSDKSGNDSSLVPWDFARQWPLCYDTVLSTLPRGEKKPEDGLVDLLLPIIVCRGCNTFDVELSKCQHCEGLDVQEFPDIQWFCSNECEYNGLNAGHGLAHEQYLLKKLGLADLI